MNVFEHSSSEIKVFFNVFFPSLREIVIRLIHLSLHPINQVLTGKKVKVFINQST